jgi:hypothetical protein
VGIYTDTNEVWVASLNADGSVGVWLPGPSLKTQQGVTAHQAFVWNNRIYISGGRSIFIVYDKVWSIGFSNSGELDSWREETPLPDQRSHHSMVAYNNRFYVLGGSHWRNYDNVFTGFTAPINADGTIGAWTLLTYPIHWYLANMFIFDNQFYLIGGWFEIADKWGPWKTYTAPINADGTIGALTRLADIPGTGPYDIPIAVHSSKGFYAFGESGIKYSGNTEYVSIGTYYSDQKDLGSNRWLKKLSYGSSEINGTSLKILISTASSLSSYPNQYVALDNGDMINQYGRFISFKVVFSPNGIPATATPILTGLTVSHDTDLVNADRAPSLGSSFSVGSSSISFQLTDRSFGETEYLISMSTIPNPTNDAVSIPGIYGSSGTVQTITLSGLSPGVPYFIRARGKNSTDNTVGYFSNEISTRTAFIPSVPTLDYTKEPMFFSRGVNEERVHIFSSATFRVKYFSGDHTPPAPGWPKVDIVKNGVPIDGSPFSMNEVDASTDYVGGKIFTFSKRFNFIDDTMTYSFQARDVGGRVATWSGAEPVHGAFSIFSKAPLIPTATSDFIEGATVLTNNVTLKWISSSPEGHTLGYNLEISTPMTPDAAPRRTSTAAVMVPSGVVFNPAYTGPRTSFTLSGLTPGRVYYWRVSAADPYATTTSAVYSFKTFKLTDNTSFNYPNPVNPVSGSTKIVYSVETDQVVQIKIFSEYGDLVYETSSASTAGTNQVVWDGKDNHGQMLMNGTYVGVIKKVEGESKWVLAILK